MSIRSLHLLSTSIFSINLPVATALLIPVPSYAEPSLSAQTAIISGDTIASPNTSPSSTANLFSELSLEFQTKRPAIKNTLGIYSGTFTLVSSKSFNRTVCTPTQSFPAALAVTGKVKRPTGQLGNLPFQFSGSASADGASLTGVFTQGTLKRTYTILLRKVKAASAQLTITEVVTSNRKKACQFVHRALFQRG